MPFPLYFSIPNLSQRPSARCNYAKLAEHIDTLIVPGTFYILPEAYDVDAEPYSVVEYQLSDDVMTSRDDVTPADDVMPFRLESVRRHDGSFDLRLVVTRTLDREVRRLTHTNYLHSRTV